jgi:hypothetical protein
VDVATTTPTVFAGEFIRYPIQFSDGQPTMYSSFISNGEFDVVQNISDIWAGDFLNKRRTSVAASANEEFSENRFSLLKNSNPNLFAMSGVYSAEFAIYEDHQLVRFATDSHDESAVVIRKRAMDVLANLHRRNPYEIPNEAGICLPGVFVADTAEDRGRTIGVTFRLKDHPDVTVFLLDSSAGDLSKMTSRQRNEFVWTSDAVGRVIHLHGPLRYRPTIMAGRLGTASFATVTRYDGVTDYAYLVTVQGDPNASVDTPDLELLIERTAKYAKGVPPVSGDQLEDIAKAIAASVKRRSVQ